MFVEIHALQSLPPSNPNRGEDGDIKTATYGGVLRSRLSSQAQKRAAREWYKSSDKFHRDHLCKRSRRWGDVLAQHLDAFPDAICPNVAALLLALFNAKPDNVLKNAYEQKNIMFLSLHEIKTIAMIAAKYVDVLTEWSSELDEYRTAVENKKKYTAKLTNSALTKELQNISKKATPGEVALFGRMMSTLTESSVDGCVQVAHALSVNPIPNRRSYGTGKNTKWLSGEIDYFVAMDEIDNSDNDADSDDGASMLGYTSTHAPVHYRYANVNIADMVKLVGDVELSADFTMAFVEGFIRSLPQGHSRQFAHQTLPEYVFICLRKDCPYSLISAFELPVESPEPEMPLSQVAMLRLLERMESMNNTYGSDYIDHSIVSVYPIHGQLSLSDAIEKTHSAIKNAMM